MHKVLIIYSNFEYPLRVAIRDHLYSFREYGNAHFYYLNIYFHDFPNYLRKINFDLIIFHTIFLANRWTKSVFWQQAKKLDVLKSSPAIKAILPQDEFIHTDVLTEFINEFGIKHVFSVAPSSEWSKIYAGVDVNLIQFHPVLTGYLSETTIQKIKNIALRRKDREIDIGYRAWHAEPWLGKHGLLKVEIAERFQNVSKERGLNVDISTRSEDTLVGDRWFEFLLRCKYTIGVEGGASLLDRDGTIREKTNKYLKQCHERGYTPTFQEIEEACFPGLDGLLSLFALSPRHLEACVTRTCQVLIEGNYNGLLMPGRHYIPLKSDFSNLSEVMALISQDELREKIVEVAYQEIVASGKCTYAHFVTQILTTTLNETYAGSIGISDRLYWLYNIVFDHLTWTWIIVRLWFFKKLNTHQLNFFRQVKRWVFG